MHLCALSCFVFAGNQINAALQLGLRDLEDYAVVYFGSALFKIIRLLLVATFCVHFFACIFYRVKDISAESQEAVDEFYASRDVSSDVSTVDFSDFRVSYHFFAERLD